MTEPTDPLDAIRELAVQASLTGQPIPTDAVMVILDIPPPEPEEAGEPAALPSREEVRAQARGFATGVSGSWLNAPKVPV